MSVAPSATSPFPITLEPTATTTSPHCIRDAYGRRIAHQSQRLQVSWLQQNSISPVFTLATFTPLLFASLVQVLYRYLIVQLHFENSRFRISLSAFVAFITGIGHGSPMAFTVIAFILSLSTSCKVFSLLHHFQMRFMPFFGSPYKSSSPKGTCFKTF